MVPCPSRSSVMLLRRNGEPFPPYSKKNYKYSYRKGRLRSIATNFINHFNTRYDCFFTLRKSRNIRKQMYEKYKIDGLFVGIIFDFAVLYKDLYKDLFQ